MIWTLFAAADAAAGRPADLHVMSPFVGTCWVAQFAATIDDTHCFETMYDGAHIRDRHEVKEAGKVIYAGETIYSADGPNLVFTYVNSLGGVGQGTMRAEGKDKLRFAGKMRASPDRAQQPIDSEWRLLDADHYDVESFVPPPKGVPNPVHHFTRVK